MRNSFGMEALHKAKSDPPEWNINMQACLKQYFLWFKAHFLKITLFACIRNVTVFDTQ